MSQDSPQPKTPDEILNAHVIIDGETEHVQLFKLSTALKQSIRQAIERAEQRVDTEAIGAAGYFDYTGRMKKILFEELGLEDDSPPPTAGEAFTGLSDVGQRLGAHGPEDLSTNHDHYLYDEPETSA